MGLFDSPRPHLVVGCGRLGSGIATMLSMAGHDVVVIDEDEDSFRKLPAEYSGFTAEGDGCDITVLTRHGIERAASVIAVTDDDNVNVMIAEIAKTIFGVPLVVARLYDPDKETVMEGTGIQCLSPTTLSLTAFAALLKVPVAA